MGLVLRPAGGELLEQPRLSPVEQRERLFVCKLPRRPRVRLGALAHGHVLCRYTSPTRRVRSATVQPGQLGTGRGRVGRHTTMMPFRDDLVRMARQANRALDGTFVSDWDYLPVTAEKR
jgi:hypothetical protein